MLRFTLVAKANHYLPTSRSFTLCYKQFKADYGLICPRQHFGKYSDLLYQEPQAPDPVDMSGLHLH